MLDQQVLATIESANNELSLELAGSSPLEVAEPTPFKGFSTSRVARKVKVGELRDAISAGYFALNDGTYSYDDEKGRLVVISEKLLRVGRALSRLSMIDSARRSSEDARQVGVVYDLAERLMRQHSVEFLDGESAEELFQWDETASCVQHAWESSIAYKRLQSLRNEGRHLVSVD